MFTRQRISGDPVSGMWRTSGRCRLDGFTLVEVLFAAVLLVIVVAGGIQGLLVINRQAAAYRAMTSARIVVQNNIETALRVPFSETSTPSILATTTSTGETTTVPILKDSSGATLLSGTLTRIVQAHATPAGIDAVIRRVTFRITYTLNNRSQTYEMTSVRAVDQ